MGTKESVLRNADALVICTEWQHFLAPDFSLLKTQLKEYKDSLTDLNLLQTILANKTNLRLKLKN
jgi:UDPglucose 6-dehydrogenase